MRRKGLDKAKLIIEVESKRRTHEITTVSVYDNRTRTHRPELIRERGIEWFLNMKDMVETLNWNLNGDGKKFRFKWGQSSKTRSTGYAYIFD